MKAEKKPLQVYLIEPLKVHIREQAGKEGMSMSDYIATLIRQDKANKERGRK